MHLNDDQLVRGLLSAYRQGLFPMADPFVGAIDWYDPDPRALIPLEVGRFRVTRSLAQRVRSARFAITTDQAFEQVIRACARADDPASCWIDERIIAAYSILHAHGHAHSIEAWLPTAQGPQLVGGLYGVAIGALFAGESMFSLPHRGGTDASKVCLCHLVGHLRRRGFQILDTQFRNPHIDQFGCVEVRRAAYKKMLAAAIETQCDWQPFEAIACEETRART